MSRMLAISFISTCVLLFPALARAEVFTVPQSQAYQDRLLQSTQYIQTLTLEQIRDMVPTRSGGIYFTSCPNCDYGAEEAGCFNETWNPRHPQQITCKGCGQTYPDNKQYPDDQYIEIDRPDGGKHRFHYYEREDGYRFWFREHAAYWAREWLQKQARDLGELYALTGDERYALLTATILTRFAEVYPGYAYRFDYPFKQKVFAPYTQNRVPGVPGDYRTARWTWWAYMDIPLPLIKAYDHIEGWPGLDALSAGTARQRIEQDLLAHLVEFVLGYPDDMTNMSMGIWRNAIYAGRVIHKPEWVHEAVGRFERLLDQRFLYDGHWLETNGSYARQTLTGMRLVMEAAQGYSDPPGYTHPATNRRFEQLNLAKVAVGFEASEAAIAAVRLPDNRLLPVNDTWASHGKSSWWQGGQSSPRQRMEPALLPDAGIAVLGGGEGENQLHAHLNFTKGRHHKHYDALAIGLFAGGRELLPDIGYTWTNYRLHWTRSTMAHSTVVVDGVDSKLDADHTGHQLRQFAVTQGFQFASAQSVVAYPQTKRYRRTLAFVGNDARDGYLIDVFEVQGGNQHDYILLGSVDHDTTVTVTGAALQPAANSLLNPGITFTLPEDFGSDNPPGYGFGFWSNLRSGGASGPMTLDMRYVDQPDLGLRTVLADTVGAVATLADVPSVRRAREINADLTRDVAPAFTLRRQGKNLASYFVAAHEPVRGEAKLASITMKQRVGVLLVQVKLQDGSRDELMLEDVGSVSLRRYDSQGKHAAQYALSPAWSGSVMDFGSPAHEHAKGSLGWFDLDAAVDASPSDLGVLQITFADQTHRAFTVTAVERKGSGSRLYVKERPGFHVADNTVHITSYPQRKIAGKALHYHLSRWAQQ